MTSQLHPLLRRLLRRSGASPGEPPSEAAWDDLLASLSRTYAEADQDRYTLERSIDISSREMQQLYQDLKVTSQSELAHERDRVMTSAAIVTATQEAAPDGILVIGEDRRVVAHNRRFAEMWRIPGQLLRRGDDRALLGYVLASVADPDAFLQRVNALYENPFESSRDEILLVDERVFDRHSAPVRLPDDRTAGRVWFFRDVTESKRQHAALERARAAAEAAGRELQRSNDLVLAQNEALRRLQRQKDELATLVVHDLKGLLTAILCNSRALHEAPHLAADDRDAVRDIQTAASTLHRMALDLLDIGRNEDGGLPLSPIDLDLAALVEGVVRNLRAQGSARRVSVETALDVTEVHADPDLLRRLLENLVDNAMRFAPPGSAVRIEATARAEAVLLRVLDQGSGVPAAQRDRIFQKYVQLGEEPSSRGGRGLGLAFCRMVSEAHGGAIWVEDNQPRGSVFCVRLPRRPAEQPGSAGQK